MSDPRPSVAASIRVCRTCAHYRPPPSIELFDTTDLQTPGGLAAQNKWDEERKQHAREEMQRFKARQPFEHEPRHYAWCAWYTMVELVDRARAGDESALAEVMAAGGATMNPVSGELAPLYILCAWKNPEGECERHQLAT